MTKDIMHTLMNPIRIRIVQYLTMHDSVTSASLQTYLADVPRATLYRHIGTLIDRGVITVAGEKKVGIGQERILVLNDEAFAEAKFLADPSAHIMGFLMGLYAQYEEYFSGEEADPYEDRLFFQVAPMKLTNERFDEFMAEMNALLGRYSRDSEGKLRNIALLSAPDASWKQ